MDLMLEEIVFQISVKTVLKRSIRQFPMYGICEVERTAHFYGYGILRSKIYLYDFVTTVCNAQTTMSEYVFFHSAAVCVIA